MANIDGMRIAFPVASEGIEQVELTRPWEAAREAGGTPVLVSTDTGEVQAFDHLDKADTFTVDATFAQSSVDEFDAFVYPGGVANPDALRLDGDAIAFTREALDSGKPVSVICHGPWTLIEADRVRGRVMTSWPSLQTDLRNAGATWVDEEVKVCDHGPGPLVSSRNPGDLDAFCRETLAVVENARQPA